LTDTSTKISFTATGCVGTSNFVLSGDTSGNSATLSYTFSQPAVTVSPAEVTLSGFTGVTLSAYTSILATPSGLSVTLGSQTLNVVAVLSSAPGDWSEFTVNVPAANGAGVVSGTVVAGNLSQAFSLQYNEPPSTNSIAPANGDTTSTTLVSFDLQNFEVSNDAADLKCSVGGGDIDVISVLVESFAQRKMSAVIEMPRAAAAGTVVVRCSSRSHPQSGAATFSFTYTLASPITYLDISEGSYIGGETIGIDIVNLSPVTTIDSLTVGFTDASGRTTYATNRRLVYSLAGSLNQQAVTRLEVLTPADSPGEVEVKVASTTQSTSSTTQSNFAATCDHCLFLLH
jgi:hypothetical protein